MENLTKQQIILLTLLVSFVTSIATGIVTVALMNQAPVGVVQTINRVVEKTIQTVTAPGTDTQTIVKETTVVNTDDQVVNAINKNSNSVMRIYRTNTDPTSDTNPMILVGLGAVISDDGIVATDNSIISDGGKYFVTIGDKILDISIVRAVSGEQIALLKIKNDDKNPITFSKVSISNNDLKLGQTVIYIGGETKNTVATGIVSSLSTKEIKSSSTSTPAQTKISAIETSISSNFTNGGLLLNLSGDLVGIKSNYMDSSKTDFFAPSKDVQDTLTSSINSQKKTQ
jgi:hypothetical protein